MVKLIVNYFLYDTGSRKHWFSATRNIPWSSDGHLRFWCNLPGSCGSLGRSLRHLRVVHASWDCFRGLLAGSWRRVNFSRSLGGPRPVVLDWHRNVSFGSRTEAQNMGLISAIVPGIALTPVVYPDKFIQIQLWISRLPGGPLTVSSEDMLIPDIDALGWSVETHLCWNGVIIRRSIRVILVQPWMRHWWIDWVIYINGRDLYKQKKRKPQRSLMVWKNVQHRFVCCL